MRHGYRRPARRDAAASLRAVLRQADLIPKSVALCR